MLAQSWVRREDFIEHLDFTEVLEILDEVLSDSMPPGAPFDTEEKALVQVWVDTGMPE